MHQCIHLERIEQAHTWIPKERKTMAKNHCKQKSNRLSYLFARILGYVIWGPIAGFIWSARMGSFRAGLAFKPLLFKLFI